VRHATPKRANDPMQHSGKFDRNVVIKENLFDSGTVELYNYGQKHNCRFYAIIRDGTGATSKTRYKRLRALVENHFYPLIRSASWEAEHPSSAVPATADQPIPIGGPLVR
jgi:hypothetical protein